MDDSADDGDGDDDENCDDCDGDGTDDGTEDMVSQLVTSPAHCRTEDRAMKTTKWHIDRFPWLIGDTYMWYDELTPMASTMARGMVTKTATATSTAPTTVTATDWWYRSWSRRRLPGGLRTQS